MPLEAKHPNLGRFSDEEDVNFRRVLNCLMSLAQSIKLSEANEDPRAELSNQANAETMSGSAILGDTIDEHVYLNNFAAPSTDAHGLVAKPSSSLPSMPHAYSTSTQDPGRLQIGGYLQEFTAENRLSTILPRHTKCMIIPKKRKCPVQWELQHQAA